jgi:hypothetical protein
VLRVAHIAGSRRFSLMRASALVNCQSALGGSYCGLSARRRFREAHILDRPSSAWCRKKAICCSLNRDCFIRKTPGLPNGQTYRVFLIPIGPVFWFGSAKLPRGPAADAIRRYALNHWDGAGTVPRGRPHSSWVVSRCGVYKPEYATDLAPVRAACLCIGGVLAS